MVGDCGTNMAMALQPVRKSRPPLTRENLQEIALNYVGRFATSRAKLISYLQRKVRERGWDGEREPPFDELADRLITLGYVDDRAFALSKARSLTARGYGQRRVRQALATSGISEDDGADALEFADEVAVAAALKFAKRRSIGPFATEVPDPSKRERVLAAMVRAGHRFALARAIIELKPGEIPDSETLFNVR